MRGLWRPEKAVILIKHQINYVLLIIARDCVTLTVFAFKICNNLIRIKEVIF